MPRSGRNREKIHETGADAGVAVNPDTPLSAVTDVMDQVEMILIMSVYPGFGGQKYIPESTERIRTLRRMLDEKGLEHVHIQVDGGINRATIDEVLCGRCQHHRGRLCCIWQQHRAERARAAGKKISSYSKKAE